MNYEDELRRCASCGEAFLWSAGAQRYVARQGWKPPNHCPSCRAERRRSREAAQETGQQAPEQETEGT